MPSRPKAAGGIWHTPLGPVKIALVAALAVSLAASSLLYGQQAGTINALSSDLTEKSTQADRLAEELAGKDAELEKLQGDLSSLAKDIGSQEQLLAEQSEQIAVLEADLAARNTELHHLGLRAASLEQEIAGLYSVVSLKDADIAALESAAKRVHLSYYGLGIDPRGQGLIFPIELEIIGAGSGRISVDVSDVDFEDSFQESVRTAAAVASEYTGVSLADKDIIFRFVNTYGSVIAVDGPSAGAAITAMIIMGLTDTQPDPQVLVTGAINPDGTLGTIGGLPGKTSAAVDFGAKKLVVPKWQRFSDDRIEVVGASNIEELVKHVAASG